MTEADRARLNRPAPPPIPILVLTGFLGAGKTTLLNGWVKTAAFSQAAVLINEFGEVGIDHMLVEKADGTMLTLSSGCVCCTVRGDLITTLEDLIRARDNDRLPLFDRLVIETTGLAEPGPILNAIMAHPYLPMRYRVEAVATVVDAQHGLATLAAHHEARLQVVLADTLILTKSDLVPDAADVAAFVDRLRELNPNATLLNAADGEAEAATVLRVSTRVAAGRSGDAHDHHHHHGDSIRSVVLASDEPLDPKAFSMFLDLLRATHGPKLLRIKGIVAFCSDPTHPVVIHAVQHFIHPPRRLNAWPDDDHRSRLVFITDGLDPTIIPTLWSGFFDGPAIDRADADGLTQSRSSAPGLLG